VKRSRCVVQRYSMADLNLVPSSINQYVVLSTKYVVPWVVVVLGIVATLSSAASVLAEDSPATLHAPQMFRDAAAKVRPSIVRIEGFGGLTPAAGSGYQAPGQGPTTGLILSEDGYIVTSTFNFLRKPPIITLTLADGRRFVAQLLGRDDTRKICLLKVEGVSDLPVPQFAPRSELKVGQWAIASGIGFGAAEPVLSAGIISATSRISGKAVQTDANTSPANYGGPLVDLDGRVIGVCVPLSPGSREEAAGAEWYDSGIGFAIPLDGLEEVLARLKAGERLQHAFLGVRAAPYGDPPTGAQIEEVVADSPAAKAGLLAKDKILAVAGAAVLDAPHLATIIRRYVAGDSVEVAVERSGEKKTFTTELAPPPPPAPPMPPPAEKTGKPKSKQRPQRPAI